MITNERQYRITHAWLEKFEDGARHADEAAAGLDPLLQQAMRDQYLGQAQELREQIAYYDALRAGRITTVVLRSLEDIPLMLIQARIAAGLTHKQLAERLQIAEQQVQRYEARDYQGVSLDRLQTVADALGVTLEGRASLPRPATSADRRTAGGGISLAAGESRVTGRADAADRQIPLIEENLVTGAVIPPNPGMLER